MNATNITANSAATTFSARRRSQAPAFLRRTTRLLQRVDLIQHALRPFLRLVGGKVDLLRVGAEGALVGRVDLQPLLPEAVGELGFALQVLAGAPRDGLVGRRLHGLLLRGRHGAP